MQAYQTIEPLHPTDCERLMPRAKLSGATVPVSIIFAIHGQLKGVVASKVEDHCAPGGGLSIV